MSLFSSVRLLYVNFLSIIEQGRQLLEHPFRCCLKCPHHAQAVCIAIGKHSNIRIYINKQQCNENSERPINEKTENSEWTNETKKNKRNVHTTKQSHNKSKVQ